MGGQGRTTTLEELLTETGWMRRLAVRLAGDSHLADDIVQDTWIAAMRRPPEEGESARPWLAKVLRNALRMRVRTDGRRASREQAALILHDEVPTPESLVAKTEAQRLLAGLVLRLEEPYRSTVLLHFGEGMTLADIARSQGIAASTARGRLKTSLDQLRAWIQAETGDRRRWALAPLLALPKGVVMAQKTSKLVAAVLLLLALLVVGGIFLLTERGGVGGDDQPMSARGIPSPSPGGGPASSGGVDESGPVWLSQPGVTPRRIAGRVIYRGAPVANASVVLASLASESGVVPPARSSTNAAGEFDFGLRPAMEWSVRASAPSRTGASVALDLRNPVSSPPPDRLEIELGACEAALIGTVRDASGGAVAGARLARLTQGGATAVPGGVAAETDDEGAYELCVERAWPGRVLVEVSAVGYGALVFRGLVLGRVKVDFALVPEATIVGRVVRDDSGEPVPKAHVFVAQGPWGIESTAWRGTFTDREGRFRIEKVAAGRHLVFARAEGMVGSPRGTPVVVGAGQTSEEIEIRLEAGSVLRGVVVQDGDPIPGARVTAIAWDGIRSARTAVSQQDGSFALEEVPRGEVHFGAWPYEVVRPTSYQVERSEQNGLVLEVESLGSIAGRVVRGVQPVAGARVHIHGPNERELEPIRTDAEGEFVARGLRSGPWILFGESEREGRFGRAPETVQLARGETKDVTIDLAYGAAIAGVVVDQDGGPVAGVSVQFFHTAIDDAGAAVSSEDGSFRAATMTGGGSYRVSVRPFQGASVTLRPAVGGEFPLITVPDRDSEVTGIVLAVQLDRRSIAGRVIDSSGSPVADARVSAAAVEDGAEPSFFRWVHYAAATTDFEGRFSIGDLSKGTYALQARASSGAEARATGIRAGRDDVVLTLPTPGAIEGTLVGFLSQPQVTAMPTDNEGSAVPTAGAVARTSFAVTNLSPGSYVVTARGGNQAASARVTVSAGTTSRVALEAGGSGTIVGRVLEFRTRAPVEGMTCRAQPRMGDDPTGGFTGEGARTDVSGRFTLADAPAGEIVVACAGLWRAYSDGLRLIELTPGAQAAIDVPVVALPGDVMAEIGGFGAEIDLTGFVPLLSQVRPGGPAANAGFQNNDRVIAVDGASVTALSPRGVRMLITDHPPGTSVRLTVTRGGTTITRDLILAQYDTP